MPTARRPSYFLSSTATGELYDIRAFKLMTAPLRYAARSLLRRPALVVVALTTLALGIGANTAIFSIINVVLLKPLPFHDPDRLVMVWSTAPNQGLAEGFSSYPDFHDWTEQSKAFDGLAAFWEFPNGDANLTGGTQPERVSVARITPGFFELLGVPPLHGRTFQAEESIVGNHRRAILSFGLWRDAFGSDTTLVGKSVLVNGFPYTVVGIMPLGLAARSVHVLGTDVQLWRPLVPEDNQTGGRNARRLRVIGRLAGGRTIQQGEADLSAVASHLSAVYPESNRDVGIRLVPLREQVVRDVRRGLVFLLAAVGVVLLGACANVANLLLIKAAATRKQVAVQYALGASRLRLSAQVLVESLLLGGAGAALGVFLAYWGVKAFIAIGPADIPLLSDARLDPTVLAFTVVATLATIVGVALLPAWRSSRPDVIDVLRQSATRARGKDDHRLMRILAVSQIALAMMLLTTSGLLIRSFRALLGVAPGFQSDRVITFQLELPMGAGMPYASQPPRDAFFRTLLERIDGLPGVRGATLASAPPLQEEPAEFSLTLPGSADSRALRANFQQVAPDYFALLGIPLLRGRSFDPADIESAPRVVVVSAALARAAWGENDPVGRRLTVRVGEEAEVIGIAGDVHTRGLGAEAARTVYAPTSQGAYNFMTVLVKTRNDPKALVPALRKAVRELDPALPLHHVRTMEAMVAGSVAQQRFQMLLIGAFSLLTFTLAILGTYGVTAYSASERTNELGIRAALGATGGDIRRLLLREGGRLALSGIVIGGAATAALSNTLSRFVFQISTLDLATFVGAPTLLAIAVLLATFIPAHRAARVDPMEALRSE
jgi:putative ABC transport system permease protein